MLSSDITNTGLQHSGICLCAIIFCAFNQTKFQETPPYLLTLRYVVESCRFSILYILYRASSTSDSIIALSTSYVLPWVTLCLVECFRSIMHLFNAIPIYFPKWYLFLPHHSLIHSNVSWPVCQTLSTVYIVFNCSGKIVSTSLCTDSQFFWYFFLLFFKSFLLDMSSFVNNCDMPFTFLQLPFR